jgi:hypothetical protein
MGLEKSLILYFLISQLPDKLIFFVLLIKIIKEFENCHNRPESVTDFIKSISGKI